MAFGGFTVTDYVALPGGLSLDTDAAATVELWYWLPDLSVDNSAFSIGNPDGSVNYEARCQAHLCYGGTAYWDYGNYSAGRPSYAYPLGDLGAWAHLVLVADDASAEKALWINGVKVATSAFAVFTGSAGAVGLSTLAGGTIGVWPGAFGASPTNGRIAHFAVYDHALSDARIAAHYAAATAPDYVAAVLADLPLAYYRLRESAGPTAVDSGPSGLDATIVGAPTMGLTGPFGSEAPASEFDLTQGQLLEVTFYQPQFVAIAAQAQLLEVTFHQPQFTAILAQGQAVALADVEHLVLHPDGIPTGEAFDVPGVRNIGQPVHPAGIPTAEAFGSCHVALVAAQFIKPYPLGAVVRFGTAAVAVAPNSVPPVAIATGEVFGTPFIFGPFAELAPPRNVLKDRKTGEVYPWPVNHATEDAIKTLGRRLTRSGISASGRLVGTRKVFLIRHPTHPGPVHLLLHGSFLDDPPDQYRTFVRFFNDCDDRTFDYIDASGDSYHIVITQFDARRKNSPARLTGSYFTYTLEVEVLAVNHGAYRGVAV